MNINGLAVWSSVFAGDMVGFSVRVRVRVPVGIGVSYRPFSREFGRTGPH